MKRSKFFSMLIGAPIAAIMIDKPNKGIGWWYRRNPDNTWLVYDHGGRLLMHTTSKYYLRSPDFE